MKHIVHDIGVARQIGAYSDSVRRGTESALAVDFGYARTVAGRRDSEGHHIQRMLSSAGMTVAEIMLGIVTQLVWPQFLVDVEVIAAK